ncbi:MAG: MlaD family protein [Pirellulaceae bacterium]|jgi:phospholipid/cholesterol/gamma-HCH transport system substrate-binding protein|nr:MlaD family protein [Pirellulaceae bacterium]MDP7018472.1 MlaD family protein [Pirellulaceae bacterium]
MDERVMQFRVGVVVLAALLITGLLVAIFGFEPQKLVQRYMTLTIRFPAAPQVQKDSPVRKSGIQIGHVSHIQLLDDDGGVNLTLKIHEGRKLKRRNICRISKQSLVTGDAVLEFVWRGDDDPGLIAEFDRDGDGALSVEERSAADEFLGDGDYLGNGRIARDPFQVIVDSEEKILEAFIAIRRSADEVGLLVGNVNSMLGNNDQSLRRVVGKTEIALDQFTQTMQELHRIVGDDGMQNNLRDALNRFPQLIDKAESTLGTAEKTFSEFQVTAQKMNKNLDNIENFTEHLGANGEQIAHKLNSALSNLDRLLAELAQFSESLNSSEGTIGLLIHDDSIYWKLDRAVGNFESASRKLEPILYDVRTFTDKVARDPGSLARGLIQPGGGGHKGSIPLGDSRGFFRTESEHRSSARETGRW